MTISLFPVKYKDKYGYIDKSGEIVISPEYDGAHEFSEGLAIVKCKDRYAAIDVRGNRVIGPVPYRLGNFSEGLAKFVVEANPWKYGFIDTKGNIIIPAQEGCEYGDDYYTFSEGLALVTVGKNNKESSFSYIDKYGRRASKNSFKYGLKFSEGLAAVFDWDKWRYGYISREGHYSIQPLFTDALSFSCGLAVVGDRVKDSIYPKCYYINKMGHKAFNFSGDKNSLGQFSEGLAVIRNGLTYSVINTKGEIVKSFKDESFCLACDRCNSTIIGKFSDGLIRIDLLNDDGWTSGVCYMDQDLNVVSNLRRITYAEDFKNGLARIDFKYYIDKAGKFVWGPKEEGVDN
jgi:hypothetical protein